MTREVRLTSPERVLWPEERITKGDLFEYYAAVAPALVPHLRDRPFTMKRYPHGIHGEVFFQKQAPRGMPDWIPTRRFTTHPRKGATGGRAGEPGTSSLRQAQAPASRLVDFPLLNSREAVQWMVQMNCIDMNAWYSRVDKPERPDFVLFDLDPPETADGFAQAVQVAHIVRGGLRELALEGYVKTSGAGGIHVLVPITRRSTFADTHEFAERLSKLLEERHPGVLTTEWLKAKRRGVFVDYHQNGAGKTIASAYSVRPKPGAPVSTPLRWEELMPDLDFGALTMPVVLERVARDGDLFEPVLRGGQALGPALRTLRAA